MTIDDLIAKQEIHENLMLYCRGVDRRERSLIEGAFHPEALLDYGTAQDTPAQLADRLLDPARPATDHSWHFIGNELIELDGERAFCEISFMAIWEITRDGREYTRARGGRYLDRCERREGVWKIAHRQTVDDWFRLDEITARPPGVGGLRGAFYPHDLVYGLRQSVR